MQTASKEVVYTNFQKGEYRAFTSPDGGQPISLPSVHERLLDELVKAESLMEQGNTLTITITVSNAESSYMDDRARGMQAYNPFGVVSNPPAGISSNSGGIYIPAGHSVSFP